MTAADYIDMAQERARLIRAMDARMAGLDALILPTTPIVAPKLERGRDAARASARRT